MTAATPPKYSGGPALPPGGVAQPQTPIAQISGNGFVLPGYSTALQGAQTSSQPWITPYQGDYLTYGYGPSHQFIDYSKLNLPMPPGATGPVAIPGTGGLAKTQGPATPTPQQGGDGNPQSGQQTVSNGSGQQGTLSGGYVWVPAGQSIPGQGRASGGGVRGYDSGGMAEMGLGPMQSGVGGDASMARGIAPQPQMMPQQPQFQPQMAAGPRPLPPQTMPIGAPRPVTRIDYAPGPMGIAPQGGGGGADNTHGAENASQTGSAGFGPGKEAIDRAVSAVGGMMAPGFGLGVQGVQMALDNTGMTALSTANKGYNPSAYNDSGNTSDSNNAGESTSGEGRGTGTGSGTGEGGSERGNDSVRKGGLIGLQRGGLLAHANRFKKGGIADAHEVMAPAHSGLVNSNTPGRADKVLTAVPVGSYIFPADIVSHAGDGNTTAGARAIHSFLKKCPAKAAGGPVEYRHVYLSGGEVVGPHEVTRGLGGGSTEKGARYLDRQVLAMRRHAIKHLKGLPAPKR